MKKRLITALIAVLLFLGTVFTVPLIKNAHALNGNNTWIIVGKNEIDIGETLQVEFTVYPGEPALFQGVLSVSGGASVTGGET